jgi:hypothetical protein
VSEDVSDEGAPATEAEQVDAEEGESEDHYSAMPSKPSHLEFGRSTVIDDEITPKPEKDEVVVFKSFFKVGLRFPLNEIIVYVLEKFGIYLHQLTLNAIARLSVYIWAL